MADAKANFRECLDAALGVVKSVATVAVSLAVLALFLIDFNSICAASQQLLARAGSVTVLKALGVELTLSESSVADSVSPFNMNISDSHRADVLDAISKLEPDEYARLMEIGQLDGLCEFEKPTAKMRGDVALDYRLAEKGLATVIVSQDALKEEIKFYETHAAENGAPLSCYVMTATDLGRDVKTVLVQSFKSAFDLPHRRGEPAANGDKVAAR